MRIQRRTCDLSTAPGCGDREPAPSDFVPGTERDVEELLCACCDRPAGELKTLPLGTTSLLLGIVVALAVFDLTLLLVSKYSHLRCFREKIVKTLYSPVVFFLFLKTCHGGIQPRHSRIHATGDFFDSPLCKIVGNKALVSQPIFTVFVDFSPELFHGGAQRYTGIANPQILANIVSHECPRLWPSQMQHTGLLPRTACALPCWMLSLISFVKSCTNCTLIDCPALLCSVLSPIVSSGAPSRCSTPTLLVAVFLAAIVSFQ